MALGTKINVLGIWRNVRDVYVKVNGTWRTVPKIYSNVGSTWKQVHSRISTFDYFLTITASTNNYNILAALGVTPVTPVNIQLTINPGVVVGSATISQPAITTGALPAGSTITIINNGSIIGKGGSGGMGAFSTAGAYYAATAGGAAGDAFTIAYNNCLLTIDNTNGYIFGGGGGGGGGGFGWGYNIATIAGSGGGGGAGGGAGGAAGYTDATAGTGPVNGNPGGIGTTSGGLGGAQVIVSTTYNGYGGNGGNYGAIGANGGNSSSLATTNIPGYGAAGGAAGKAINYGAFTGTLTWLGGNTIANVKGAVIAPNIVVVPQLHDIMYVGTAARDSLATTHSFSGLSFGYARSDRIILVCVRTSYAYPLQPSAFTIGGVNAVEVARQDSGGHYNGIWAASIPTGASGTVSYNTAAGCTAQISVHAMYGKSLAPFATAGGIGASINLSTNLLPNDVVLSCGSGIDGAPGCTWTGVTEVFDSYVAEGGRNTMLTSAQLVATASETPRTITCDMTISNYKGAVLAVWR